MDLFIGNVAVKKVYVVDTSNQQTELDFVKVGESTVYTRCAEREYTFPAVSSTVRVWEADIASDYMRASASEIVEEDIGDFNRVVTVNGIILTRVYQRIYKRGTSPANVCEYYAKVSGSTLYLMNTTSMYKLRGSFDSNISYLCEGVNYTANFICER